MLAGTASLQADCVTGAQGISISDFGGQLSGFLGPSPCSKLYGYTWFITWYTFLMLVLTPILVIGNTMKNFRAGFLGLLAPLLMLLGDMSNTYIQYDDLIVSSTASDRARALTGGAVITSIGFYLVLIFVGIVAEDEEGKEKADAPSGETYGGMYGQTPEPTMTYNPSYTEKS